MKRRFLLFMGLLLAACASPVLSEPLPTTAPDETPLVVSSDTVVASAEIQPAHISQLGFTISALVKEISVKEGDAVQAGDMLMTLNTPDLDYAVIAAENDYNARELAAQLQKAERVLYVNPNTGVRRWYAIPNEVYLKAKSKADQSKAIWDTAVANLAQSTLTAPFDATVVDIAILPGELVQVNQVVITLADLTKLQVTTTDLSERDIARVKIGQSATIHIEALDAIVTGRVIRISPIADTVGGDVVFPITIELDEQPKGLLWGMSAEVEIQTK